MNNSISPWRRGSLIALPLAILSLPSIAYSAPVQRRVIRESDQKKGPPNDDIFNAGPISGQSGAVSGSTVNATTDDLTRFGLNSDLITSASREKYASRLHSVWYYWTAPTSGGYTFHSASSVDCMVQVCEVVIPLYVKNHGVISVNGSALHGPIANGITLEDMPFLSFELLMHYRTQPGPHEISSTFNAVKGTTYFIMVEDMDKGGGGFALSWKPGPDNDNFVNAASISDEKGSMSGTNIGASCEDYEPIIGTGRGPYATIRSARASVEMVKTDRGVLRKGGFNRVQSPSVWYRWIAPADGDYTFHVKDDFVSTISVMSGDSVDNLTVETKAPKPLFPDDRYATLHAVAGTAYSVVVADWDYFLDGMGPFTLNWMPTPKNDNFAKAISIKGDSGHLNGTNLGASVEKDEAILTFDGEHPDSIGSSVWYQWIAPANASYRFGADGKVHHIVAVTSGENVKSLKDETGTASHKATSKYFATVNAVKGSKYNILVEDYHAEQGDFDFNWDPRPGNDDFGNAIWLDGKVMTVVGTNIGSTDEAGEPALAQKPDETTDAQKKDDDTLVEPSARRSVWYRWTASYSDPTSFTVVGDKFTPALTVYTGSALGALAPVGMEDNSLGETTDRVSFTAVAGTSYYILVDGADGKTGRFSLSGVSSVNAAK